MSLCIHPITLKAAMAWVRRVHRHELSGKQRPVVGGLWAHAVRADGRLCGVAIVGRPVARHLDDGSTAEVVRVATDGTHNACSALYGAASRAARALGYVRLVTYILASEPGTSLRAAGWVRDDAVIKGQQWDRPNRPRQLVLVEDRQRWWAPWGERTEVAA